MAAEKDFENRIKDFLKEQGCWFVKYWSGRSQNGKTFTKSGIPDILVCCNGFFVGIEVKASKGKPSALQLHNLKKIDETHGFSILLYPDQWDVFKDFIRALNESNVECLDYYYILKERWWEEWQKIQSQ